MDRNGLDSYQQRGFIFILLTVVLTSGYLLVFYHHLILNPNSYLISIEIDGLYNYFSYVWHIKHDHSLLQFTGLNYPFGE